MSTLKKLWLVGILLAPVGLQAPPAAAQCLVFPFATSSEDVCESVCAQGGCSGYQLTNNACYCTWPSGGGGGSTQPEEPQSSPAPPPASSAASPSAHGAAAVAVSPR